MRFWLDVIRFHAGPRVLVQLRQEPRRVLVNATDAVVAADAVEQAWHELITEASAPDDEDARVFSLGGRCGCPRPRRYDHRRVCQPAPRATVGRLDERMWSPMDTHRWYVK